MRIFSSVHTTGNMENNHNMIYQINGAKCNGCGKCKRVCQTQAISGVHKQVHHINPDLCQQCGRCQEICRHNAIWALRT